MTELILIFLLSALVFFSIIFNFRYPKKTMRKNIIAYHNDNLSEHTLVKRTLLRMFLPGIDIPIIMMLLIVIKSFDFDHPYLVYGSFITSTLVTLIIIGLGFHYYIKEKHHIYRYELVFVEHHYKPSQSIQAIKQTQDTELQHASRRMDELTKTVFVENVFQVLLCVIFLVYI